MVNGPLMKKTKPHLRGSHVVYTFLSMEFYEDRLLHAWTTK